MSNSPDFTSLTPMVPAGSNMKESLGYFCERLGFRRLWHSGNMAAIRRGSVELLLLESDDFHWAQMTSFSIGVAGLDALFAEYQAHGVRVGKLERKPWGRREFHLLMPSGICIQFFEVLTPETAPAPVVNVPAENPAVASV